MTMKRSTRAFLQVEMLESRLTPAVATPSQNFVSQAYLDLLGRQVDAGGLATWSKLIDSGVSRTQVVSDILASSEYLTNKQIVPLYQTMLGRGADPVGLANFLHFMQTGGTPEQVAVAILGSPEFLAKHGGTNDSWLDGAYAALGVGNPPGKVDAGGRAGWDSAFAMGATRQQVASLLVNGIQHEQNTVSSFYLNFLHRSPEASGLSSWVGVEKNAGELFVLANIIGSPEYFARAQTNPQTPFPTISALSTSTGAVGTSVVFTGTFLDNTTGLTIAGDAIPPGSFSIDSATQITATIPAGAAAGTGPVTVTTPFGPASSASSFTIGPAITSFSPSSGPQGTSVTITGTNLTGATAVTIDGLSVTAGSGFTVNSDTSITATVPTGGVAGSSGPITVTTAFGTATSAATYTLSAPGAPSFTVAPVSGKAGDVVTLTGTNLFGVTSVTFNGVAASVVAGSNTSTSVQVTVPASTNGNIVVTTTPGNTGSAFFSYPATVTGFNVGAAGFGQTVTITGTNFLGATAVSFNGSAAAAFTVVNNTTITATVPNGATTGPVVVTTGAGASNPSASLTIVPPPSISANPSGNNETATIQILGSNLSGATVSFGGTTATVTSNTASEVDVSLASIANVVRSSLPGGGSFAFTVSTTGGTANATFIFNGDTDDTISEADDVVQYP